MTQDILKMYCERIDNTSGVSLKQCHRLKSPKVCAKMARPVLLTEAYNMTRENRDIGMLHYQPFPDY